MLAEACTGIRVLSEYCSRCVICSSICPFEAISLDRETGNLVLNSEKCQVCGLCFSACPSASIDITYYRDPLFIEYIERMQKDNLILVCKGAAIKSEIKETLRKYGILDDNSISLYVPCVGRIPPGLILKALMLGVKRVVAIACEDDKCRFKSGSNIETLRFVLLQRLLNQLGFSNDTLIIARSTIKAHVNEHRCIGCGNCAYICQYNAIRIGSPGVARINRDACLGCGACAAVCPALAISLEGFEHDSILATISKYSSLINEVKAKSGKPAILVFYCQWASFSPPDKHHIYSEENIVFLEVPCSSMLNPLYIVQAIYEGFDGVVIAACKKGECKFERGNELAEQHITALKKLLRHINLENKLEICFVSPKYLEDLNNQVKLFISRIGHSA